MGRTPEEKKNTPGSDGEVSLRQSFLLYLHDLIYVIAVLMILFILFFRIVTVSGPSMNSTLWDGDWLLVMARTPFLEPKQGDIVISSKQSFNDGEPIIKRVIATEKQTVDIDFSSGIVYVDGEALDEPYTFSPTNLDEGVSCPLVVEENCFFVMGDNRNHSNDSRNPVIGLIDRREIVGKALFLVFPGTDGNIMSRNFDRIGALS